MDHTDRTEERVAIDDNVIYLPDLNALNNSAKNGIAFDVSASGACIYTQREFDQDEIVKFFCKGFGEKPRKAIIKWCKKVDDRLFKVGVLFIIDD